MKLRHIEAKIIKLNNELNQQIVNCKRVDNKFDLLSWFIDMQRPSNKLNYKLVKLLHKYKNRFDSSDSRVTKITRQKNLRYQISHFSSICKNKPYSALVNNYSYLSFNKIILFNYYISILFKDKDHETTLSSLINSQKKR